jgi:hypothetical protein
MTFAQWIAPLLAPVSALVAGGLVFWIATRPDKPRPPAE